MAVTAVTTVDITAELEKLLATVDGLRVYAFVADNFRPPGAVIALPTITYDDPEAGFCSASWEFPVSIIVNRNQDRAAQDLLARLVSEVALALNSAVVDGWFSIEVLTATPTTTNVSGADLPSYAVRVRVRA